VHHLDSWKKIDQLYVTCFIISLYTAQHVSNVNTSIFRSLRLIWWVISWVVLFCKDRGWSIILKQPRTSRLNTRHQISTLMHQPLSLQNNTTHEITHQISRKLLRMDVLASETCWAVNNEIIKQVTSSWSLFNQLWRNQFIIPTLPCRHLQNEHNPNT